MHILIKKKKIDVLQKEKKKKEKNGNLLQLFIKKQ